eukprot:6160720-Karenia_brevis.AAC.1
MTDPRQRDMKAPKHLCRYVKGKPGVPSKFEAQTLQNRRIIIYSDSDSVGCLRTRKSTTGAIAMLGSH